MYYGHKFRVRCTREVYYGHKVLVLCTREVYYGHKARLYNPPPPVHSCLIGISFVIPSRSCLRHRTIWYRIDKKSHQHNLHTIALVSNVGRLTGLGPQTTNLEVKWNKGHVNTATTNCPLSPTEAPTQVFCESESPRSLRYPGAPLSLSV